MAAQIIMVLSDSRSTTAQLMHSTSGNYTTGFFIVVGVLCM